MRNWLLPEFIEDVMPAEAGRIESLRRQLLDLFKVHGYQYVIPPTLEYVESLITGTGSKLDIATFKVVDQLTGRMMGIRADTTPQAARIDAHMLTTKAFRAYVMPVRYCEQHLVALRGRVSHYRLAQNYLVMRVLKVILKFNV